jgi:hypothetical protein
MKPGTASLSAPRLYGLLAEFQTPEQLLAACEKVRDAGFTRWDAHAPFPVHGLNDAMGIRPTRLPWFVLAAGLTGAAVGVTMQWWMNAVDYPWIVSGKPFWSLPANVPVAFEVTILLAAATAFVGMLALNGLPRLHHPLFKSARFRRATADRFFISIEADDPRFDPERTESFLRTLGGSFVEIVEG